MQPSQTPPSSEVIPTKRFNAKMKIAMLIISLGLTLGLAELAFRLFVPVTNVAFQFWDPAVGIRRKPNQRGVNIAGRYVHGTYNFNSQGWNYPRDFTFERIPGSLRVCLIGDSYVEALQVNCDEQMAVIAEKALSRKERPAECFPFGCSGFGTAQDYQVLRHYVLDYRPDVVVLFFTQNDVYDSSPYLSGIEPAFPVFALDDRDELLPMVATSWERSSFRRVVANLALTRYFLIQQRLLDRFKGPQGPGGVVRREAAGSESGRFLGGGMSTEARAKRSWLLIEKLLAAAYADCNRAHAKLLVVYRGSVPEVKAAEQGTAFDPPPREKDPYCLDQRIDEMGRDFLSPMCARLGIAYLDLADPLKERVRREKLPHNFPDDDHYNALGHRAAGEAIAAAVEEMVRSGQIRPYAPGAPSPSPDNKGAPRR